MIAKPQPPVPYVHQAYPSWRYHATAPARIIQSPDEEAAGWMDAPFQPPSTAPSSGSDVAPSDPIPVFIDDVNAPDARALELYAVSAADAIAGISRMTDRALVEQVREFELRHPKYAGGRKSVLAVLDAQLVSLA